MNSQVFDINKCPIRKTLKILGGKWALLIIFVLRQQAKRFSDIRREMPDISEKMLIQNLKMLESEGYLHRFDYQEVPPRVEYSLKDKGLEVLPLVDEIIRLGRKM